MELLDRALGHLVAEADRGRQLHVPRVGDEIASRVASRAHPLVDIKRLRCQQD